MRYILSDAQDLARFDDAELFRLTSATVPLREVEKIVQSIPTYSYISLSAEARLLPCGTACSISAPVLREREHRQTEQSSASR